MTNADKFREVFGIYATELWAKPENDFLKWLNTDFARDIEMSDTRWIPVSERLPEDTERYLVTLANGDIDIGWIRGDEYLWDLVDIDCEYFLSDKRYQVVAWMPLPKPYKEATR